MIEYATVKVFSVNAYIDCNKCTVNVSHGHYNSINVYWETIIFLYIFKDFEINY